MAVDRWPVEMQMIQESLVWLIPTAEMARSLVAQAGIPEGFIDFSEPVWNRIKRIMVEAQKREMLPALLTVITSWYPENLALQDAKAAWEAGQDRAAAAAALRKAAKEIPEPTATAKITRKGETITDVDVEVDIPEVEADVPTVKEIEIPLGPKPRPKEPEVTFLEIPYSDELMAGDWFSAQKTLADFEKRISELEAWRAQLSIIPTPEQKS